MNILEYLEKTYPEKKASERFELFAESLGTITQYVYQLATGRRRPGPEMTRKIIAESGGQITLADLRPDYAGEPGDSERLAANCDVTG